MIPREKSNKIATYLRGANDFDDIPNLKPALLDWRPEADMWTIHEHMVHLLEAEVANFHRYRKAIAEPGGKVVGFDEERFVDELGYEAVDLRDCLALFKLLRKITAAHLTAIVERDWSTLWFQHDQRGKINLETWLVDFIGHAATHREYIDRNLKLNAQRR